MNFIAILLFPITLIYKTIFNLVQFFKFRERIRPPFFTISIGNIEMGGTGKTPTILTIINKLNNIEDLKNRLIYISRGYKREIPSDKYFFTKWDNIKETGDEAMLIMQESDVNAIIGKNRVDNIKKFLNSKFYNKDYKLAILDDGFQHIGVERDLNIVLLNVSNFLMYLGGKTGLPFFKMRESFGALKRADAIVFTKNRGKKFSKKIIKYVVKKFPNTPIFFGKENNKCVKNIYKQKIDITNKKIVLISGIANNSDFINHCRNGYKIDIIDTIVLSDHNSLNKNHIEYLINNFNKYDYILTTQKDFIKLCNNTMLQTKLVYLEYNIEVDGLIDFILDKYNTKKR